MTPRKRLIDILKDFITKPEDLNKIRVVEENGEHWVEWQDEETAFCLSFSSEKKPLKVKPLISPLAMQAALYIPQRRAASSPRATYT